MNKLYYLGSILTGVGILGVGYTIRVTQHVSRVEIPKNSLMGKILKEKDYGDLYCVSLNEKQTNKMKQISQKAKIPFSNVCTSLLFTCGAMKFERFLLSIVCLNFGKCTKIFDFLRNFEHDQIIIFAKFQ